MKKNIESLELIRPDDWHVHLREGEVLKSVIKSSTRVHKRCIVMPNLKIPITNSQLCMEYKMKISNLVAKESFKPLIPCYLTDKVDIEDFEYALENDIFIGAKLYPTNSTTNSKFGVSHIENIYSALELLIKHDKPLLIHGEKVGIDIDIFDREKQFIDSELVKIVKEFPSLKIVLEHVSSKYGADFVFHSNNIAATITPHHMLLTKKDVFKNSIQGHYYCMPVVKEEKDLLSLRKYACSGSNKFFIGTDSAPHEIHYKENTKNIKPGIFSAICSIELYADIFDQENALMNLEKFISLNGPNFYNLAYNNDKIKIIKNKWKVDDYTIFNNIKIKNFYGGKILNWKIEI